MTRARVERFAWARDSYMVRLTPLPDAPAVGSEVEAHMRHVLAQFQEYVQLNKRVPDEVLVQAQQATDAVALAHHVAAHLLVKVPQKQVLLEQDEPLERLRLVATRLRSGARPRDDHATTRCPPRSP